MNENNMNKLEHVDDTEDVARILFSPSFFEDGELSAKAFDLITMGNSPETYISVLRMSFGDVKAISEHFIPRTKGDTRCGYALLNVGIVRGIKVRSKTRSISMDVKPYPKHIEAHAGIVISDSTQRIKGGCDWPEYMLIKDKLARASTVTLWN